MREIVLASTLGVYHPITQKAFEICDQEQSEKQIHTIKIKSIFVVVSQSQGCMPHYDGKVALLE